jgi:lysophospholipase L1-like esterase
MNPAALFFAGGDSLYPGILLLILAVAATPLRPRRWLRTIRNLALWLGLAMAIMASPPVDWRVEVIFAVIFLSWSFAGKISRSSRGLRVVRFGSATALTALLIVLFASEFLNRRMPTIPAAPTDHLVVIGDSISAGIGRRTLAWPTVLQQQSEVRVQNLSLPGAGVADALTMSGRVGRQDLLVLIEIGGNDLLSGVSSAEFARNLDLLLSRLIAPGRTLVMFELPLLPHKTGYGIAQRRLSARYGVFLIPKHCFTDVLASADATSDGLHLSDTGAFKMAALVARVLCPVLKTCDYPKQAWNSVQLSQRSSTRPGALFPLRRLSRLR